MNITEFFEKTNKAGKIGPDTEILIHVEDGDFPLSALEYSKREKTLRLCAGDCAKKNRYRIDYRIYKDHNEIVASSEYFVEASSDEELLLEFDDYKKKILEINGVEGEENERSGSVGMKVPDIEYFVEDGKLASREIEKTHYFSCELTEIFKVSDDEHNVYVRVWHSGRPY